MPNQRPFKFLGESLPFKRRRELLALASGNRQDPRPIRADTRARLIIARSRGRRFGGTKEEGCDHRPAWVRAEIKAAIEAAGAVVGHEVLVGPLRHENRELRERVADLEATCQRLSVENEVFHKRERLATVP